MQWTPSALDIVVRILIVCRLLELKSSLNNDLCSHVLLLRILNLKKAVLCIIKNIKVRDSSDCWIIESTSTELA